MYFFSELKFPNIITCGLKLNRLGNSSVEYEIGLFSDLERKNSGENNIYTCVFVDVKTRRPKKIPQKLLIPLKTLMKN